jgi:pimeloyl-ACP methyl ester carboxylesterase
MPFEYRHEKEKAHMELSFNYKEIYPFLGWMEEALEYGMDTWQRLILYADVVRQQGTDFIEENDKGLPPVLDFEYQVIFNGRDLDRPVNYSLARIMPDENWDIPEDARPIIIIDPRAGHGPGVGGMKKESEVGLAMKKDHPVYFMIFSQFPVPGQTLADVAEAEVQFIEVVRRFHPKADKPAVIGNCQAGWAAALLAADRPDITGPLFLNGSPLSYWAGKDVRNPIRYKGGLLGGIWAASLSADLGNGFFDGANLVKNFEDLNPANTWWKKKYNLYANVDTEADRFLHFEKWWNGFFFLSAEEIRFITQDLFVGNKLEQGDLVFRDGKKVDLKQMRDPIFVFASDGDNITAPQQALNWVMRVWGSVDEIKRRGQVIIYLLHKDIGHLGIFVSAKVVNREHHEMLGHVDLVDYLAPGLYEMIIEDKAGGGYDVRFEARDFGDIKGLNEARGELEFKYVSRLSDINDNVYRTLVSPWVKMLATEFSAEIMRRLHPLRRERYLFSDLNPWFIPLKAIAPKVRETRIAISDGNMFRKAESAAATAVAALLDYYRDMRDLMHYQMFYLIYGHPVMEFFFGGDERKHEAGAEVVKALPPSKADDIMTKGGMAEGLIRCMTAMSFMKKTSHKNQLIFIKKLVDSSDRLVSLDKKTVKRIINEQAEILKIDFQRAVESIPHLITAPEDKLVALHLLELSVEGQDAVTPEEQQLLDKFRKLLKDRKTLS